MGGFQQPNLDYAVALTPHVRHELHGRHGRARYAGLVYTPTMLELGIVVGVLGLGALLLLLGLKFLPLKPVED